MAIDFSKMETDKILRPERLGDYKEKMKYFHLKLAELHHNVYFAQHIHDFPLDLFGSHGEDYFLFSVVRNFLEMSILKIAKLTTDNGKDAQTLRQFKNFMASAVRDELEADYRELLKGVKWDARTESLIKAAKHLRDTQIAHSVPPGGQGIGISFDEIKELVRELTNLFEAASFDTEYRYLMIPYDPGVHHPPGSDPRPDIERILDSIARESVMLNLPEDHPRSWPLRQERWSREKVEQFNHYRRKFGLPEV